MISIIIPTLNRCDLLKKTIDSILKHNKNYELYELIVIDNGSSDATKNIFEDIKHENKDAKMNYFFDDIPGLLTGRHRGVKESKGEILTFIDDDVEVSETWLNAINEIMIKRPEVSLLTGPCLPNYEINPPDWLQHFWTNDTNGKHCGWLSLMDFGLEEKEIDPLFVWGLNFTIRKSVFEDLKGFHPDSMPKKLQFYQGDGETGLSIKAKESGNMAFYSPKISLLHFVPKSRLSIEYLYERSYFQGVADGYTEIRRSNGLYFNQNKKISIKKKLKRFIKKRILNFKSNENIPFGKQIQDKYNEGKNFIRKNYLSNEEVKSWILKINYLE